jgi:hypothetical protein
MIEVVLELLNEAVLIVELVPSGDSTLSWEMELFIPDFLSADVGTGNKFPLTKFRFREATAGIIVPVNTRLLVRVRCPGYTLVENAISPLFEGEERKVQIYLSQSGNDLLATCISEDGNPIDGVAITSMSRVSSFKTNTNEKGEFYLPRENDDENSYIVFSKKGYEELWIKRNEITDNATIKLKSIDLFELSGKCSDMNGNALGDVSIHIRYGSFQERVTLKSSSDGSFKTILPRCRLHEIMFMHNDYQMHIVKDYIPKENNFIRITLTEK